jgi:hypothetical protein
VNWPDDVFLKTSSVAWQLEGTHLGFVLVRKTWTATHFRFLIGRIEYEDAGNVTPIGTCDSPYRVSVTDRYMPAILLGVADAIVWLRERYPQAVIYQSDNPAFIFKKLEPFMGPVTHEAGE